MEVIVVGYGFLVGDNENVLKFDSGDNCTT